jgi:hypothetical protein
MPLIYDLSIGKNHMLSVSIILNKKMLHFYEQSWQNQIERILPKGLIQSKCKIFKMIQKMPLSLYIWISIILFISQFSMIYLCFLQSDLNDPILNYPIMQNGLVFSLFFLRNMYYMFWYFWIVMRHVLYWFRIHYCLMIWLF